MFRSAEMQLVQIVDRTDAARDVICCLGEAGLVHFRDMNGETPTYKRAFAAEVKRSEEMGRRLNNLAAQIEAAGLATADAPEPDSLLPTLDAVEETLRSTLAERQEARVHEQQVAKAHNALKEHLHCLALGGAVFDGGQPGAALPPPSLARSSSSGLSAPLLSSAFPTGLGPAGGVDEGLLHVQVGTITRTMAPALMRAVHRITRGNCVVHDGPIDEPLLGIAQDAREPSMLAKNFVMLVYSGATVHTKVSKICAHFGCSMYPYPEARGARQALQARLEMQMMEMRELVRHTTSLKNRSLRTIAANLPTWSLALEREKATLHTLNMCSLDIGRKTFVAEGWVPTAKKPLLVAALQRAAMRAGGETVPILTELSTNATPPTYIRTTRFTAGFQGLVDTYGIPRYGEVNPGAFAVILFPFLFAIMFGDVGHGLMLVLLALFFIANEEKMLKQKLDDIVAMAFGGRYVLLLNGLFAMYVGFLYNEAFSVPLGIFPSTWSVDENATEGASAVWDGTVYPFGVDPMWQKAANKMSFFNSFKMKISIVFGVAQMTLGISLSLINCLHFNDRRSIWFGFVPEMVFFLGIFGYLVVLIFSKWATDWVGEARVAPSLLNTLIAMFMSPGVYTEDSRIIPGQEYIQLFLITCAVIAVPFLLIPKPLLFYLDQKAAKAAKAAHQAIELVTASDSAAVLEAGASAVAAPSSADAADGADGTAEGGDEAEEGGEEKEEEEEEDGLGDVVVHQAIHTIEFVLGSISNTASYLRLWALSLAHSQLSELFWEKVMKEQAWGMAIKLPAPLNGLFLLCFFAVWFILNVAVLMVMENLSSFLHALRLQWVEFQNKFYKGDGYKYHPFGYETLGAEAEE